MSTFVRNGNASIFPVPVHSNAAESPPGVRKVVIVAPEWVDIADVETIVRALERRATVFFCRDDIKLHYERFEAGCKGGAHLIMLIDDKPATHERDMVNSARRAGVKNISLLCMKSCYALDRFRDVAEEGRVKLVVVRTPLEHPEISKILGGRISHTLMLPIYGNLKSARDIARSVLGAP